MQSLQEVTCDLMTLSDFASDPEQDTNLGIDGPYSLHTAVKTEPEQHDSCFQQVKVSGAVLKKKSASRSSKPWLIDVVLPPRVARPQATAVECQTLSQPAHHACMPIDIKNEPVHDLTLPWLMETNGDSVLAALQRENAQLREKLESALAQGEAQGAAKAQALTEAAAEQARAHGAAMQNLQQELQASQRECAEAVRLAVASRGAPRACFAHPGQETPCVAAREAQLASQLSASREQVARLRERIKAVQSEAQHTHDARLRLQLECTAAHATENTLQNTIIQLRQDVERADKERAEAGIRNVRLVAQLLKEQNAAPRPQDALAHTEGDSAWQ